MTENAIRQLPASYGEEDQNTVRPSATLSASENGRSSGRAPANQGDTSLARALGWLSLGLGLAQVAAPRQVARLAGIADARDTETIMRAVGVREIASGLGILMRANPAPWLWARVGGDVMDLALLRSAAATPGADHRRLAAATAAVISLGAADVVSSAKISGGLSSEIPGDVQPNDVRISAAITVNAPIAQVYQVWEGFKGLPQFVSALATIELPEDGLSRWTAALPAGGTLSWDVQITEAIPNEQITWQAAKGSLLAAEGSVRFRQAPADQGTEVIFSGHFSPPGGEMGRKIGGLVAEAMGMKMRQDLRHFKQLMEIGEISASDDSVVPGPNPARPIDDAA